MAMDQRVFSSSSTHRIIDNFRRTTRLRYQERRNLDLLGEYISDIRTVGCIMLLGAVAFVGIESAHWAVYKVRPLPARLYHRGIPNPECINWLSSTRLAYPPRYFDRTRGQLRIGRATGRERVCQYVKI